MNITNRFFRYTEVISNNLLIFIFFILFSTRYYASSTSLPYIITYIILLIYFISLFSKKFVVSVKIIIALLIFYYTPLNNLQATTDSFDFRTFQFLGVINILDAIMFLGIVIFYFKIYKLVYLTKKKNTFLEKKIHIVTTIILLGAILSPFYWKSFIEFTREFRNMLYISIGYYFISDIIKTKSQVNEIVKFFLFAESIRLIFAFYDFINGFGIEFQGAIIRYTLLSDSFMIFIYFVILTTYYNFIGINFQNLFYFPFYLFSIFSIIYLGGKASWILLFLCVIILLFTQSRKISKYFISLIMVIIPLIVIIREFITSDVKFILGNLLNNIFDLKNINNINDLSTLGRLFEIINVSTFLWIKKSFLWGLGWGAQWYEIAIRHPLDLGSFPEEELFSGWHTLVHLDPLYLILKIGIIGTLLFYLIFYEIIKEGFRIVKSNSDNYIKYIIISILLSIFLIIVNGLTFSVTTVFLGIFLGLLTPFYKPIKI